MANVDPTFVTPAPVLKKSPAKLMYIPMAIEAINIEWEPLKEIVGKLLGDWRAIDVPDIVEGQRQDRITHVPYESNQTQIGIAYDSVPYRDPDYFQASGAVNT